MSGHNRTVLSFVCAPIQEIVAGIEIFHGLEKNNHAVLHVKNVTGYSLYCMC